MVRLKVYRTDYIVEAETKFQFLMVRLKVYHFVQTTKRQHISIPYGAIKSIRQCD